jgi:AraC-like DNA-binding protein
MLMKLDKIPNDLKPVRLSCQLLRPKQVIKPNRHNEIEIYYLPDSSITFKIHNCKFKVRKGSTVAFWSLMPHQIVGFNEDNPYYLLNIPVSILYKWKLPRRFLDDLFRGEVQTLTNLEDHEFALKRFKKWTRELEQDGEMSYSDCMLEISDHIKRFAFNSHSPQLCVHKIEPSPINLEETMAMFIANNFTEPIKVSDVAREVGLNPDYANSIFKRAFCTTISNYIMEHRVLYAQRRLSNTNDSITSLAFQSGFNSICRFNVAFKKKNNLTPREYRKRHLLHHLVPQL